MVDEAERTTYGSRRKGASRRHLRGPSSERSQRSAGWWPPRRVDGGDASPRRSQGPAQVQLLRGRNAPTHWTRHRRPLTTLGTCEARYTNPPPASRITGSRRRSPGAIFVRTADRYTISIRLDGHARNAQDFQTPSRRTRVGRGAACAGAENVLVTTKGAEQFRRASPIRLHRPTQAASPRAAERVRDSPRHDCRAAAAARCLRSAGIRAQRTRRRAPKWDLRPV